MNDDKRLIEDYLPIVAISAEASREKSVRKGHISTLHLWWARRPLVACRAAVYGALVPASRFVPNAGSDEQKKSLGRANAAKFVERLCQYPGNPAVIAEAQRHILEAHAQRLTRELREAFGVRRQAERDAALTDAHSLPDGPKAPSPLRSAGAVHKAPAWCLESNWPADKTTVTVEDIVAGRAPRPRVLDMFAGGGAIPLEALRLGCEAYALDLNPVAHIIELCTLVYPQKYGKPDPSARGMTGAKNAKGEGTWGGLADEVRYWGERVLNKVKAEIGDLYPLIPDPEHKGWKQPVQSDYLKNHSSDDVPPGYLMPVAYLWTRTVTCKNPICKATVPLVRQTWLCKKDKRYIALKMVAPRGANEVRFETVQARSENGLAFDPAAFSKGGNATCPFCGTVADIDYVKAEGCHRRIGHQLMTVVCEPSSGRTKWYLGTSPEFEHAAKAESLLRRADEIARKFGITVPDEPLEANPRSFDVQNFGFAHWRDVFTARQLAVMVAFSGVVKATHEAMLRCGLDSQRAEATLVCLSCGIGRLADYLTSFCTWQPEFIAHMYDSPGLPMIVDFAEGNPLAGASGSWASAVDYVASFLESVSASGTPCAVARGSSMALPFQDEELDAIVTDPPYYDSRSYSNLSDHFYVWHKRTLGNVLREHFAAQLTPKKTEAIAAAYRCDGDWEKADANYESMMLKSFVEACRVLKPGRPMICVYAHKTTAGWATLVNALRRSGFLVEEAWPVEMERKVRKNAQNTAALASSIFLVARKREGAEVGNYEEAVEPELEQIVRERVETLWAMGISGADLVIACVGAGLRAFTRFARVEYANGEEVPAERFLAEVETVVLETILARLSKEVGGKGTSLAGLDAATRFYILWRYTYSTGELDAGEAIIFANGTHVELDGQHSLTSGIHALVSKKKSKFALQDFAARGGGKDLGLPSDAGQPAPLVDVLHRTLWLMEKRPAELPAFLRDSQVNREQLRLVAQALAGPALKGGELGDVSPTAELSALGKITANWQSVVEDAALTTGQREEKKLGQKQMF